MRQVYGKSIGLRRLWNSTTAGGGGGGFTPADLFASGEDGGWYDPSDLSTLWQDTGGTVAVTSDGDSVARMDDKSGNGNHFTQATAASRPVYKTAGGLHWLRFDGVDDVMSTAAFASPIAQPTTLIVGADFIDTRADRRIVTGLTSGARQLFGSVGNDVVAFAGTSLDSGLNNPQAIAVWTAIFDGANGIIRKDGTQLATGNVGTNAQDGMRLGVAINFANDTEVDVYSLIFVEGALTGTDLTDSEQWSADRTGT